MRLLRIGLDTGVICGRLVRAAAVLALASALLAVAGCAPTFQGPTGAAQRAVNIRTAAEDAWRYSGEAPVVTTATPIGVLNGDRAVFMVPSGELEVRMIGITAPQARIVRDVYDVQALNATKEALSKTPVVYLEVGAQSKDAYGVTLAYVWLKPPSVAPTAEEIRTNMLNARLLEAGLVKRRTLAPGMASLNTKYSPLFNAYQAEARTAQVGLWNTALAQSAGDDPTLVNASTASVTATAPAPFLGNSATHFFHRSGCPKAIKMSQAHRVPLESEAQAYSEGFKPCGLCLPKQ